ncbi:MAG: methylated-DNA-protein-cysteine methyltransferase-like protein [Moritella sp.]|jgi:methylated-DNA-protein-cysteine methyltransferase-like protein
MVNLAEQVFALVHRIPVGKVATYGDIARLAGMSTYSRHVGRVLSSLPTDSQLPWHRIINSKGEILLQGERGEYQKQRLLAEGIVVSAQGKISLKQYRYDSSI